MNEEQPSAAQPGDARPVDHQSQDPRRRLRELLAIPDRERTDALWDELIALEIQLAPGNRAPSMQADAGRHRDPGRQQDPGRRPEHARRQDATSDAKPGKRFFKRPKRGPGAPPKA